MSPRRSVFSDPLVYEFDEGNEHGEVRHGAIGEALGKLLFVTYTSFEEGEAEVIRIISARKADTKRTSCVSKAFRRLPLKCDASWRRLDRLPDDQIDFSDIPKMTDEDWKRVRHYVGLHYYPGKKSVTIRLDDDMVKWFKTTR